MALIHGICIFEDGFRAATAASLGAPSFRRTQAPFDSTTTSCSCSPWFFVLLFPHDKNFAFIFDMQALVRLFLSCGSPCVRSTSDCAVLMATPAHKGRWHGFQPICIATAPYAVRCLQRTSDCYEVNRVSVSPTNDVFFCRELPLFEWWEKSPEGKEGVHLN